MLIGKACFQGVFVSLCVTTFVLGGLLGMLLAREYVGVFPSLEIFVQFLHDRHCDVNQISRTETI